MGKLFHWEYLKNIKINNFISKNYLKWEKPKYWKPEIKEFF